MVTKRVKRSDASLRQAWSDYLRGFHWEFFLTLTFDRPTGRAGALAHTRRWIAATPKSVSGTAFFVVERGGAGSWHAHLLISGTGLLTRRRLRREWRKGVVHVEAFDPGRGAAHYVSKFSFDTTSEYDFEQWEAGQDSALSAPVANT